MTVAVFEHHDYEILGFLINTVLAIAIMMQTTAIRSVACGISFVMNILLNKLARGTLMTENALADGGSVLTMLNQMSCPITKLMNNP